MLPAVALAAMFASPALAGIGELTSPGPYGVGVRTLELTDYSRTTMAYGPFGGSPVRELVVEVWYPAATAHGLAEVRGAQPAESAGAFPLVARAHGLGGTRRDAVYLTTFLASHGYVVVAPDFPLSKLDTPAVIPTYFDVAEQPGDLSYAIDRLVGDDDGPASFLRGSIDARKIASLGHSLGGLTVLLHGYDDALGDPRVRAVAALAPWACSLQDEMFDGSAVPSLWMGGTADLITPFEENQLDPFDRAAAPRVLVALERGIHINFSRALFEVDPGDNPDDAYCDGTFGLIGLRPLQTPKLPPSVGGKPEIDGSTCGKICREFDGDFMDEARQHDLTRAAVLAFLDAELRGSQAAYETLATALDAEPDVSTTVVEGACAFGTCMFRDRCTACGRPAGGAGAEPTTADALLVLRAAIGLGAGCPDCVCDVDADLAVDAVDALLVLARAVGTGGELTCLRAAP